MRNFTGMLVLASSLALAGSASAQQARSKPTIVLVHGAFVESSSWNSVIEKLGHDGYTVVAAANPLLSVASDAAAVSTVVKSLQGLVVLVDHSYGGLVITQAPNGVPNIKACPAVQAAMRHAGLVKLIDTNVAYA